MIQTVREFFILPFGCPTSWRTVHSDSRFGGSRAYNDSMNNKTTSFYIRRTWTTFTGRTVKVDHVGPYMENQEFAVGLQRQHDMRRQVPATEQITKWEWVQGKV